MTRVKKNVEILNYSTNTVANLNWRAKRDVSGYYGCGDCGLCKLSIFGDKFKVHHTNYWYKISGGLTATTYRLWLDIHCSWANGEGFREYRVLTLDNSQD